MASCDFAKGVANSGCFHRGHLWLKRLYNLSASHALSELGLKLTEDTAFLKQLQGGTQRMEFEGPKVKGS